LPFRWSRHAAARILPHRLVLAPNLGCLASCPFCRAGQAEYREAPLAALHAYIRRGREGGATEAVLHSLSLSQYSGLEGLGEALDGLDVTVGSMRADELGASRLPLLARLDPARSLFPGAQEGRSRRLVLAPETANPAHYRLVGKRFGAALLARRLEEAHALGFRSVMLYFMLGLPGESEEDVDQIASLVRLLVRVGTGWSTFDVKVMQFEAEPLTPLERAPLARPEVVTGRVERLERLLSRDPGTGVVRVHSDPEPLRRYRTFVKRGDRRAGLAALQLHRWGVRPDQLSAAALVAATDAVGLGGHDPLAPILGAVPWSLLERVPVRLAGAA
jgi:radical SAM superfamily enzyme YgiQ (UPF0313 family)